MFKHHASIKISSILHRDKILKQNHWICGSPLVSFLGVHSAREIPVLIPNTEVKPGSGDYTALRETSKMPNYTKKPPQRVAFRLSRRSLGKRKVTRRGGRNFCSLIAQQSLLRITTGCISPGSIILFYSHPNGWFFVFLDDTF